MTQLQKLLTIEEVAEYLGVTPRTVWEWKSAGYGPSRIKVGRRTYFLATEVERWLAAQQEVQS